MRAFTPTLKTPQNRLNVYRSGSPIFLRRIVVTTANLRIMLLKKLPHLCLVRATHQQQTPRRVTRCRRRRRVRVTNVVRNPHHLNIITRLSTNPSRYLLPGIILRDPKRPVIRRLMVPRLHVLTRQRSVTSKHLIPDLRRTPIHQPTRCQVRTISPSLPQLMQKLVKTALNAKTVTRVPAIRLTSRLPEYRIGHIAQLNIRFLEAVGESI